MLRYPDHGDGRAHGSRDEEIVNSRHHRNTAKGSNETSENIISVKVDKCLAWIQKQGEIRTCRCIINLAI